MKVQTLKKTLSLVMVALVLVTSMGFASAVHADDTDGTANAKGVGRLTAEGDGIALLAGRGVIDLRGHGILWVKDAAGDAIIIVNGHGEVTRFPDGWIQYAGLRGTAHIKGSKIRVVVAGTDIELSARGRGRVLLWGHGTYNINGELGRWHGKRFGAQVKLAPPADAS